MHLQRLHTNTARRSWRLQHVVVAILCAAMLAACSSGADPVADEGAGTAPDAAPTAAATDEPTDMAEPTDTPAPADTGEPTEPAAAGEPVTLRVGFAFPPDFSMPGYFVSDDVGYFEQEGITVEPVILDGTAQVIQQLLAGSIDVGIGGPPAAVLLAAQEGSDVGAFYGIDQVNIFDIVVPADSDVQSLEDLEGQTLGVTALSGGEIPVVNAALSEAGFREGEEYVGLEVVAVGDGGPQVAAALESGRIQAYAGGDADTLGLRSLGMELRSILPERFAAIPGNILMATAETMESDADAVAGFGRAFAKGTQFAISAPDAALELGCEFAPEGCTDPDFAELAFDYYVDIQTPRGDALFGDLNETGWEATAEILKEQGEIPEDLDHTEYMYDQLLERINDFDPAEVEADAQS